MGQTQSGEQSARKVLPENLSSELAHRFADKCFTPLELTHFKDTFRSLADEQGGIQYWKEETLCRFLALPDALGSGPVIFQMVTYLGAFPFPSLAPAILTREAMVKVVVIMTERYGKVLKRGLKDRNKLLFRSLAVFDSRLDTTTKPSAEIQHQFKAETFDKVALTPRSHVAGFSMDEPGNDDDDEDDDELALAALDSLDAIEVYKTDHRADKTHQAQIPADNWRGLIMLLLIIAPLDSQESLSALAGRIEDSALPGLRRTADSILWAFAPEKNPAISYTMFSTVVGSSLPYLFDGLNPLFEHFLFSKNLDFAKFKSKGLLSGPPSSAYVTLEAPLSPTEPLLPSEGEILNMNTLSQLSFFIKSTDLFRRLRLLYSGNDAGFSINSIQQKVLNWRAPSILLVSGTRLQATANRRAFAETLPASRFPSSSTGNSMEGRVVFGAYLNVPWKQTHREAIGDDRTLLFQLEPVHEVFRASTLNRDYVTFTKSGIGLGVPPPKKAVGGFHSYIVLGAVSLLLDENLEFGVFTHEASGGGAFGTSRTRKGDWQDRFEIESLEVWGCGGDDEAERQRQAWKWEEREAAARRGINLGRDKDADYALLEMAGLVGGHGNSGGSMG